MTHKNLTLQEHVVVHTYWLNKLSNRRIAALINRSHTTINRLAKSFQQGKTPEQVFAISQRNLTNRGRNRIKLTSVQKEKLLPHRHHYKHSINTAINDERNARFKFPSRSTIYHIINTDKELKTLTIRKRKWKKFGFNKSSPNKNIRRNYDDLLRDFPNLTTQLQPGHLQIDSVVGINHETRVVTMLETNSRYLWINEVDDLSGLTTIRTIIERINKYPRETFKSILTDRGTEFSNWMEIEEQTGVKVYFADPGCAWQKVAIENVNRIIRRFYPKRFDFNNVDQDDLNECAFIIKDTVRESLGYLTPLLAFKKNQGVET